MVLIIPFLIPKFSRITAATGPIELVVQEALEMTSSPLYFSSFTPSKKVWMSPSPEVGAETITRRAPARMCMGAPPSFVKNPRAFKNAIHFELFPGKLGRVFLCQYRNFLFVHLNITFPPLYVPFINAVGCVVFEQMSEGLRVRQIVDRHDFQTFFLEGDFKCGPANAAKSVDSDSDFSHNFCDLSFPRKRESRECVAGSRIQSGMTLN